MPYSKKFQALLDEMIRKYGKKEGKNRAFAIAKSRGWRV
jgi:hypothetical protein